MESLNNYDNVGNGYSDGETVLSVKDLAVSFKTYAGEVQAVRGSPSTSGAARRSLSWASRVAARVLRRRA